MKRILLLGATGSIGSQALAIIKQFPQHFTLVGIAGGTRKKEMRKIQKEWNLSQENVYIKSQTEQCIKEWIAEYIEKNSVDIFINAISGVAGIEATEKIITQEKPLCLANKESLVARGEWIMKNKKCEIYPLDSEHSSMANLLSKVSKSQIKTVWLTASGGPFRDAKKFPKTSFSTLSPNQAMAHPNWDMGNKISIDSATLMNKAFEFIEAIRLFDLQADQIKVIVHPQSIVHAAVETIDGNIVMEASTPTMLLPIARELFNAAEKEISEDFSIETFSPFGKTLSFEEVDNNRFPSLEYAKKALAKGENTCRQMLEENDKSVDLFCNGKISFQEIFSRIEKAIA